MRSALIEAPRRVRGTRGQSACAVLAASVEPEPPAGDARGLKTEARRLTSVGDRNFPQRCKRCKELR